MKRQPSTIAYRLLVQRGTSDIALEFSPLEKVIGFAAKQLSLEMACKFDNVKFLVH